MNEQTKKSRRIHPFVLTPFTLCLAAVQLPALAGDTCPFSGFPNATGLSTATGELAFACGPFNIASGESSTAFGYGSRAAGRRSSAFGYSSDAIGANSVAMGGWYDRNGSGTLDATGLGGETAYAGGISSVAMGAGVQAVANYSAALGVNAIANAEYSTAIGFSAVADREYTISVGSATQMNQIVNLAAGTEDQDAVNLSQLYPLATALGGGASYAGGIFTAPTYLIQSSNYTNIGTAFAAVDTALTDINQRIVNAGGIQGERGLSAYEVAVSNGFAGTEGDWLETLGGSQGPAGPTGPEGPAGGGPRSVTYDSDTRDVLTMAGADGTRIAKLADAVEATDAVNLGQMQAGDAETLATAQDYADAGDAETLASANDYTDNTATETLSAANTYTDQRFAELTDLSDSFESFRNDTNYRFHQQDRRIDRVGAMSSAMIGMASSAAAVQGNHRTRIGAGVGSSNGAAALSVGIQHSVSSRTAITLGGAFSGKERSAMIGVGIGL